jgi:hypothetical protein
MTPRRTAIASACLLSLGLATTTVAAEPAQPTREELAEQLRQLQARVAELEAKQPASSPATSPTAADVDRVVHDVLTDAERRSRLMMQDVGLTGGFDLERSKFFIRSGDGNFLLMPGFLFQARNTTNVTTGDDDGAGGGDDDDDEIENGFEVRRMRFYFTGNVFTPELTYRFQWESASNGGGVFLQDAFVRYAFARDWAVQVGQFYDEFSHEQSMLDPFTLAADRSLVNALIGGGQTERVQGAMLIYDDREHWSAQLAFHDGFNSDNTDFTDDAGGGSAFLGVAPTDFGVSGRVDYFFSGTRKAYENFTALGTTEDLLVLGAGADFSQGGDSDALFHVIDLQYENTSGCGGYLALHGLARDVGAGSAVPAGDYYDWGVLAQASHLFTRSLEGFVRYDFTRIDEDALAAGAENELHEVTVGGNYYFQKHNVKFTLDVTWLPNGVPINLPALGFVASDEDEFVIRAQLQLFI